MTGCPLLLVDAVVGNVSPESDTSDVDSGCSIRSAYGEPLFVLTTLYV